MDLSNINNAICFVMEGSLADLKTRSLPNYVRATPIQLEKYVNDSLQLTSIKSFVPAFLESTALYLEPDGINLILFNLEIDNPVWIKGTNVSVRRDAGMGAQGTYLAEQISWSPGVGATNELKQSLSLKSATTYTLRVLLEKIGGQFGPSDVIYINADNNVSYIETIYLADLNQYPNCTRSLEITFTSLGRNPESSAEIADNQTKDVFFRIVQISNNVLTLRSNLTSPIQANDFELGQLRVRRNAYIITANSAYAPGRNFTVTLANNTLLSDGVEVGDRVYLFGSPDQNAEIIIYCEGSASVLWKGIQLEQRSFSTSMIFQQEQIISRDGVELDYAVSPIANLSTFGIFIDLEFWKGNGNLIDLGNVKFNLVNNSLIVILPGLNLTTSVQEENLKIFLFVNSVKRLANLYIDGICRARAVLTAPIVALRNASMKLTSQGVRAIKRIICTNNELDDGEIRISQEVRNEVKTLFDDPDVVNPIDLQTKIPTIVLPSVTIPPSQTPDAQTIITEINSNTNTIEVDNSANFEPNMWVVVARDIYAGEQTRILVNGFYILSINNDSFRVDNLTGLKVGDLIFSHDDYNIPGIASVRLPIVPVDPQIIRAVDAPTRSITLDNVTAFTPGEAFIITPDYQDVDEIIIERINELQNTIIVNRVNRLAVGYIISQPLSETLILPQNYYVEFLQEVQNVTLETRYLNGIVLKNKNPFSVTITPLLTINY